MSPADQSGYTSPFIAGADDPIHGTHLGGTGEDAFAASDSCDYENNSPDTLASLWLQLDENLYRPDARGAVSSDHRRRTEFTDGYRIRAVAVEADGATTPAEPVISDTRMQVRLPRPLKGGGARVKLHVT